jgi:hypothetical protein
LDYTIFGNKNANNSLSSFYQKSWDLMPFETAIALKPGLVRANV